MSLFRLGSGEPLVFCLEGAGGEIGDGQINEDRWPSWTPFGGLARRTNGGRGVRQRDWFFVGRSRHTPHLAFQCFDGPLEPAKPVALI